MGRRKINIEPITHERNRTVTFIKRKAGLFKKAHELAVLCQVDVAVIILGHNNTFYEFSSVDTNDLIRHYQGDDLPHDIKGPGDYGDYVKKERVVLNPSRKRNTGSRNMPGPSSTDSSAIMGSDMRPAKRQLRNKISSSIDGASVSGSLSNGTLHDHDDDEDEDDDDDDEDMHEDDDLIGADEDDEDDDNEEEEDDEVDNEDGAGEKDGITSNGKNVNISRGTGVGKAGKNRKRARRSDRSSSKNGMHSTNTSSEALTSNDTSENRHGSDSRFATVNSASATSLNSISGRQSPFSDMKSTTLSKQQNVSNMELKFNPLQEHVQRQFHNLYNSKEPRLGTPVIQPQMMNSGFLRNSMGHLQDGSDGSSKLNVQSPMTALRTMMGGATTPSPTEEVNQASASQKPSVPSNAHQQHDKMRQQYSQQKRPVLRVEIPTSNAATAIKSDGDSGTSDGHPKSANDPQRTPSNVISQALSSSPVVGDKPRTSANSGTNTGFLYNGLASSFAASPSVPLYFATPLQAQNNATSMLQIQNPQNYLMQRQLQYAQQQHQLQQNRTQVNQPQAGRNSGQTQTTMEQNSGPLTGSLPSKFAHDLIVQSPNTSIGGMFQEWPFPPNTNSSIRQGNTLPHLQTPGSMQNPSQALGHRQQAPLTFQQQQQQQQQQRQVQQQQPSQQQPVQQKSAQQQSTQNQEQLSPQQQQGVVMNGSPGLSPYINVNQTPTSKTFNFGNTSSTSYDSEKGPPDK